MRIGNKAIQCIVLGIICSAGFIADASAGLTPQRLQNNAIRYTSITTILGQTDVAPDYRPEPVVLQTASPYADVPYHLQQNRDFNSGYVLAKHRSYSPLLNTFTVMTVSTGVGFPSNLGMSQSFFALGNHYTYQANHPATNRALVGAFIGQEYWHLPRMGVQLGLAYYQPTSAYSAKGLLAQGPLTPAQLHYKYNATIRQLILETKFLTQWYRRYYPYVSVGLGEAFNNVYSYKISNSAFLTNTPMYVSAQNRSFAYRIGFGMDVDLVPHLRLGFGYRFADWGRLNLGTAFINAVPINAILKQTHLYTNELLGQLSYFF